MLNSPWHNVEEGIQVLERQSCWSGFDKCNSLTLHQQCIPRVPRRHFLYKGIDKCTCEENTSISEKLSGDCHP